LFYRAVRLFFNVEVTAVSFPVVYFPYFTLPGSRFGARVSGFFFPSPPSVYAHVAAIHLACDFFVNFQDTCPGLPPFFSPSPVDGDFGLISFQYLTFSSFKGISFANFFYTISVFFVGFFFERPVGIFR